MATYSGTQIARAALREIGIVDPIEAGAAELIDDALTVGTDLLDTWRTDQLTASGVTRSVYSLTTNQQSYTIGSAGNFDQDYPTDILRWSVIPDDDATNPVEQHRGRPLTDDEWQGIRVKSTTGSAPSQMWYDKRYAAGFGRCLFWPIPDNADVDIVLYGRVPAITSLVAATSYDLQPGFARALKLGLANELAESGRYEVPDSTVAKVARRAAMALGALKRANIVTRHTPIRPEFLIGSQSRTFNIRTGT